ncbi:MAG: CHAT domain-containing tetratricopeptide repeat protein [Ferruginibacter sp.]
MSKLFLLFFFFNACNACIGQDVNYQDSMTFYSNKNEYKKAIFWSEKNLNAVKEQKGINDTLYAAAIDNLAQFYFIDNNFNESTKLYGIAADIYQGELGNYSNKYLGTINELGESYNKSGDFKKAEKYFTQAIEGKRKISGTLDSDFPNYLNSLGSLYRKIGRFEEAEKLFLQSLGIYELLGLTKDKNYGNALNSIAVFYYTIAKYKKAEVFFQKSMEVAKLVYGENKWEYGVILNNFASLNYQLGDFNVAVTNFNKILPIVKNQLGEAHPLYGTILGNLGAAYQQLMMYKKAEGFMLQQIKIFETTLGKKTGEYDVAVSNLGNLYLKMHDDNKAKSDFLESLALRKEMYGEKSILFAMAQNNLGLLYARNNENAKADSFYTSALKILNDVVGTKHPEYLVVQNNYCEFLQKAKRYDDLIPLSIDLLKKEKNNLAEKLDYLSTAELQSYVANKGTAFTQGISSLHFKYSVELVQNAYESQLFLKGIAIQNFTNFSKVMENATDTGVASLWTKYKSNKIFLSKLLSQPIAKRSIDIDSLADVVKLQEKELLRKSASYRTIKEKLNTSWKDVKEALQKNEVAIEFVCYRILEQDNNYSFKYAALLLRPEDASPIFIKLCAEKELITALQKFAYKDASDFSKTKSLNNSNTNLYHLIWYPVEKYLKNTKTIYFSPDGLLHRIAFAAIPYSVNELLSDRYQLVQLTSTRQVLKDANEEMLPSSALLFGGIDYNAQNNDSLVKPNVDAYAYVYQQNHRGVADSFVYLKGSLLEVQSIEHEIENKIQTVHTLTGQNASESNFRAQCNALRPGVIHFATHGFTLPGTTSIFGINNTYTISKNPLVRTGLIMAGGNKGWKGQSNYDKDDGVLTGLEIASLQLPNTELAILSACETANGEIRGSEGVFGLQRAFKLAGVKYVMASLWQVPDLQTKEFMNSFYAFWMAGNTIQQSFGYTQKTMRRKYAPYYWAAFTLVQ